MLLRRMQKHVDKRIEFAEAKQLHATPSDRACASDGGLLSSTSSLSANQLQRIKNQKDKALAILAKKQLGYRACPNPATVVAPPPLPAPLPNVIDEEALFMQELEEEACHEVQTLGDAFMSLSRMLQRRQSKRQAEDQAEDQVEDQDDDQDEDQDEDQDKSAWNSETQMSWIPPPADPNW